MIPQNSLKKIAESVTDEPVSAKRKAKPVKSRRTHHLLDENYQWLQVHCAQNNIILSNLIDEWIANYRKKVEKQ